MKGKAAESLATLAEILAALPYANLADIEPDGVDGFRVFLKREALPADPRDVLPEIASKLKASSHLVFFYALDPVVSPPPPPPPLPLPPRPWWESLPGKREKIYPKSAGVLDFRTSSATTLPAIGQAVFRQLEFGKGYEVWNKPFRDSEWICIYDGAQELEPNSTVLWVRGDDMRTTP